MGLSHVSSFAALLNVALATFALCLYLGACAQDVKCAVQTKNRVVSYYFGSYHLDKRNEERLGKGWTEWVAKGHQAAF